MEINKQIATATAIANAVEVASGILRRLDGNDISSSQDGPRDIEQDVAVVLNKRYNTSVSAMGATVAEEINNAS
ncbi:hypothetical protein pEaSNUABM54_00084 [Erwinia phage pEa_SNUABM_54]|nr:hypothetical protein pEaSNUABM54_00084 [Erwinia phage pEa_SNUABM_54]